MNKFRNYSMMHYLFTTFIIVIGYICSTTSLSDDKVLKYASKIAKFVGLPEPLPEIMEEAVLEATDLIKLYGYPAENHTLSTEDGYILTHHRIPYSKNGKTNESAVPVLLVHGMNCESTQWFDNGPESLAFVLADEGYDVWLANYRGTSYSSHYTLTRNDDKFWNFNIQDLAEYDIRPLIDHILNKTGFSKLLYIGQSMGTALSFFILADKPEYNKKIAGNIALAPVLSVKYVAVIERQILKFPEQLRFLTDVFKKHSFLSVSPLSRKLTLLFCPSGNPTVCENSMNYLTGYDPYLRNKTRVPIYSVHCSSGGSSLNIFIHLAQMKNNFFTKYNYGKSENLRRYNLETPPLLYADNITVPTVLIHGANDIVISPLDVELTKRALPNVVGIHLLPDPMVTHTDYMFAKHGKEFLYTKIIAYLKQLQNISNK